jgi:NADH dehydrogenase FAD-containing subunit
MKMDTVVPGRPIRTAIVAGGGPDGAETTGETTSIYPLADITIMSGGSRLLARVKPKTGTRAQKYLQRKLGVKVVYNIKVTSTTIAKTGEGHDISTTIVTLSDGKSHTVDLYIDATGGVSNSEFLSSDWLDDTKRVMTRHAYFRVKGSQAEDVVGVYVLGDIVARRNNSIFDLDAMVPTVYASIGVDIAKQLRPEGPMPKPGLLSSLFGDKSAAALC